MKKLIIKAHPNPEGFTHKIADVFKKISEEKHEVKIIDLYNEQFRQKYLRLDEKNQPLPDESRSMMQDLITWADELVFVYPIRWGDAPAIVKNWFDTNMTGGFAYEYTGKTLPKKLLTGKKARILFTTGGPKRVSYTLGLAHRALWKRGRLGYCGIDLVGYQVFADMGKNRLPEDRTKMLSLVEDIAKK